MQPPDLTALAVQDNGTLLHLSEPGQIISICHVPEQDKHHPTRRSDNFDDGHAEIVGTINAPRQA